MILRAALAEFPSCLKCRQGDTQERDRRKVVAGTWADVVENGSAAGNGGYVVFGLIHDGSDVFAVSAAGGVPPKSAAAGLIFLPSRERPGSMAATDSAIAAIVTSSRYAFALSASVISEFNDASARSSTSAALSMNDVALSLQRPRGYGQVSQVPPKTELLFRPVNRLA